LDYFLPSSVIQTKHFSQPFIIFICIFTTNQLLKKRPRNPYFLNKGHISSEGLSETAVFRDLSFMQ